tara:strand:- start:248987 stop:250948 length:1962 start_codon:yes stop_codon:yes gene_type:complete
MVLAGALAVSACASSGLRENGVFSLADPLLQAPAGQATRPSDNGDDTGEAPAPLFEAETAAGTVAPFRSEVNDSPLTRSSNQSRIERDSIQLAFDDAPIQEVVSAVLGDMLGEAFVIDPNVNGRVSLRSTRPVRQQDIPRVLDRALQLSGYGLSQSADGSYIVANSSRSQDFVAAPRLVRDGIPPGQSVLIVPLNYTSAQDMSGLLEPFRRTGGHVVVDAPREILILSGSAAQLEAMLEMVSLFDVDWLDQMSFGLYPLRAASPDAIVAELNSILGGPDGPVGSQIEFVPFNRLNAVVAIAKHDYRLDQVEAWVERLDVHPQETRQVRVRGLVNSDAITVAQHLTDLFSSDVAVSSNSAISVRADEGTNSLLISANDQGHREVEDVVEQLDRAPDQVLIEALIIEVVLTDDLRYGVQWFLDTRDGGQATSTSTTSGSVVSSFPGFSYTYASDYVRAALNAISSLTEVETVSAPQIVVRNNQSAVVQVGDQVPIVTQSAVSVADPDAPIVNSIQFRDTGVTLNVTARIDPNGLIVLGVVQEVSSVSETTTSGIDSPTIQRRRLESMISLYDGETVVLGGLIRAQQTRSRSGLPALQNAPVVGNLFRDTSDTTRRTELLVFLSPRVMRSREDALAATRDLRTRMNRIRQSGFGDG